MPKKRKNQKSKTSNIGSSSLLPARHDGEKPDLPFCIKTEPSEDPDIKELFSMVESSKQNALLPKDADISNDSNTSTATEPMETVEGIVNNSNADLAENQVVPTSFEQVLLKQEPIESEVGGNEDSMVEESMLNNLVSNSANEDYPVVKKEPFENKETCQELADQEMTNAAPYIKEEPTDNSENVPELQNCSHEKLQTKRKPDKKNFEEALGTIRKRMKTEPDEDDGERSSDIEAEEIIDHDIAVLPVPKVQKQIDVVTIFSDEDEEDQNSESQNVSTINLPKKIPIKRNFSIDILKYFNVVSELDRYDCQTSLDYLSKYKTKNALQTFFPIVKKEEKPKNKIQKEDILFKRILTETDFDAERPCSSENVDSSFLNKFPIQSAAESASNCVTSPGQHATVSQYGNIPVQHAAASQYVNSLPQHATASHPINFSVPSTSQSTMILPLTPVSLNFGPENPQIAVSVSNSCTGESDLPVSVPALQKILEFIQMSHPGQNLPLQDFCAPKDPRQNMSLDPQQNMSLDPQQNMSLDPQQNMLLDPHKNIPSKGAHQNDQHDLHDQHQNILIYNPQQNVSLDLHKNIPSKVAHQNVQLNDPRLRKKPRLENGSTIPVISSQPAAPLPCQNYERFPVGSASSYPVRVSSVLAAASPSANKVTFPDRKGVKDLLLYHNVGRDDITQHFETLILQWNPSWMEIQKRTGSWPPICNSYPTVVYFYRNEMDYYNTYVPLHLLHIWCNMYECWEKKTFTVIERCKVQSVERLDDRFKISCSIELEDTQVWPKRDDIIWCNHNGEEAFLLVEDVRKRPTVLSISKLKIHLRSVHDLNLKLDDELNFCILWNIRTACLQTEALNSLDSSMRELVLKPESFSSCIGIIQLDINKHIKEQRDAVFKILKLDDIRAIVIETYHGFTSVLLLTHLAFNIVYDVKFELIPKSEKRQLKVLIIIKCNELFTKLYRSLSSYKPVLAVRTKQINLDPELIKHTLEHRLDKKEILTDILSNHHIFMTTFSAFGSAEKTHLSKLKNLICIIDDAHLCTEVETALPLTLKIKKLLLIGDRQKPFPMPDILRSQNYHVSLFVRLLKAKRHL